MGLPMFREPEEAPGERLVAKLDRQAATRRSSIRREPSIRPARSNSPRALLERMREQDRDQNATIARRHRAFLHRERQRDRDSERQLADLEAEIEILRSVRHRQQHQHQHQQQSRTLARTNLDSPPNDEYERLEEMDRLIAERLPADSDPDMIQRLRRAALLGFPVRETRDDGIPTGTLPAHALALVDSATGTPPLPRPSRESALRFEVDVGSDSEQRRSASRRESPRPGWSATRSSGRPGIQSVFTVEDEEALGLTPGFAPARTFHPNTAPLDSVLYVPTPPPESYESSYPSLRRVNHMSPQPMHSGPRVDGLGDRQRSPTPVSDVPEEENWATLLTTMDSGRSSTATSFLSSRSDSARASNRSSQATTTATSFGEIGAIDDSCDLDLPSGITEEDVREIRAQHGRLRRDEAPRRSGPDGPLNESAQPPAGDWQVPSMVERESWRSMYERIRNLHREPVSRASGEVARTTNDRIMELEFFGIILERMQRREDIPDEWWAAVGLSSDVVRGSA